MTTRSLPGRSATGQPQKNGAAAKKAVPKRKRDAAWAASRGRALGLTAAWCLKFRAVNRTPARDAAYQAKWAKALLASAMRCVFSRRV